MDEVTRRRDGLTIKVRLASVALALIAMLVAAGCRKGAGPAGAAAPAGPPFEEMAAATGLKFHHFNGATGENFMPEIMGPGAGLIDYDNDGDLDVFLPQGTALNPRQRPLFPEPDGWKPGHRLFRNELISSGRLSFTDVSEQAGIARVGYGMGVAAGDYDNDGDQDIYVTAFGPNTLYRNNGDGTFTDVTRTAGVDDPRWSTSAAWVDYDRDGRLDLFVVNYVNFTVEANKRCYAATGELDYCTPSAYRGMPSRLFRNLGNGRFQDVTEKSGVGKPGPGLGVVAADFNNDGWTDLYVANDGAANHFWVSQGNGSFREMALASGIAYNVDGMAQAGMGVTAADFDDDGDEDLLVTNLRREGCVIYRNDGRGNFHDATAEIGLLQPTFPHTGFGVEWFDYDNDGYLDLFMANGAVTILETLRGQPYPFQERNLLFHHTGSPARYEDVTQAAGPALQLMEVSRAAAFGDLDNDGDVDIVVSNNNGPTRLLVNQASARSDRDWLVVRLESTSGARDAFGARLELTLSSGRKLVRRLHTDSSYLAANDPRVHFGIGRGAGPKSLTVIWPDGSRETWGDIQPNRVITLRSGSGRR